MTTGALSDLLRATRVAKDLITKYGMSDLLGPRTYGEREEMVFLGRDLHEQRDYSDKTAQEIDDEIKRMVTDALATATRVIGEQKENMKKVVDVLLDKEIIEKEEFETIVGPAKKSELITEDK